MFKTLALAATLSLAALGASAATLHITQAPTSGLPVDNPMAASFTGTFGENVATSVGGVRLSPWAGTSRDGGAYSAVTGSATYVFDGLYSRFSLVWGSPDGYNSLAFYRGTTFLAALAGSALSSASGSNLANPVVTITGMGDFDTVVFTSTSPAFEYANVRASVVPLPAGGLLLAGAIAGLAALRRRRRG